MPPLHVVTTVTVASLDIGHRLGALRSMPIGAAAITGRVQGPSVHFTLDSFMLQPSSRSDLLLRWLDQRLGEEQATIAGYQLSAQAGLLDALPGASWSPAVRSLAGAGIQPVMDLSARELRGKPLTFQQACANARILCAQIDPGERLTAWCRSDTDRIDHQTQIDAIACWLLVMKRVATIDQHSARIVAAIEGHFVNWLHTAPNTAARLHASDIAAGAR